MHILENALLFPRVGIVSLLKRSQLVVDRLEFFVEILAVHLELLLVVLGNILPVELSHGILILLRNELTSKLSPIGLDKILNKIFQIFVQNGIIEVVNNCHRLNDISRWLRLCARFGSALLVHCILRLCVVNQSHCLLLFWSVLLLSFLQKSSDIPIDELVHDLLQRKVEQDFKEAHYFVYFWNMVKSTIDEILFFFLIWSFLSLLIIRGRVLNQHFYHLVKLLDHLPVYILAETLKQSNFLWVLSPRTNGVDGVLLFLAFWTFIWGQSICLVLTRII